MYTAQLNFSMCCACNLSLAPHLAGDNSGERLDHESELAVQIQMRSQLPRARDDVHHQVSASKKALALPGGRNHGSAPGHPYQHLVAFYEEFLDQALADGHCGILHCGLRTERSPQLFPALEHQRLRCAACT